MLMRSNSILIRMTTFITMLVFGQSILLTGVLLAAGLLSRTSDNAIQSFYQQVTIRKNYLQAEIRNRWMNITPFEKQITEILPPFTPDKPTPETDYSNFFHTVTPLLIALLRSSLATGAFVILDPATDSANSPSDQTPLPALYLRDYDPSLSDTLNRDLFLVLGPSDLAAHLKIPLDTDWRSVLPPLEVDATSLPMPSRNFFNAPRVQTVTGVDPNILGFWSEPFRVVKNDIPVITYSMPLVDADGHTRGVMGIEVNMIYLSQFLESAGEYDSHTEFLLALRESNSDNISMTEQSRQNKGHLELNVTSASYNSKITPGQRIALKPNTNFISIYSLFRDNKESIVSAEPLPFYTYNTPYSVKQWYFVGVEKKEELMGFVHSLRSALFLSFMGSLILGIFCGIWGSWRITQPVTRLANAVRTGMANPTSEATGLQEIDDLAHALADAHQKRQESTVTMSRIIELVDEPIGAFEFSSQSPTLMTTDQLARILNLDELPSSGLLCDKMRFIDMLEELLSHPEPEEKHVYKISETPAKWVRMNIRTTENRTLGVVIDVTREMHDKLKIRFDRDYDALTRLLNHASFQRQVEPILPHCCENNAALIMFDLDNLKPINDSYGHGWGDIYIKTAAQLLSAFRTGFSTEAVSRTGGDPRILVGRRSGDEFVVFLHDFDSRQQILELVSDFYIMLDAYTLAFPDGDRKQIHISAGLAWVESPTVPYDELLQCADFTLYNAKRNFKGRFCIADNVGTAFDIKKTHEA